MITKLLNRWMAGDEPAGNELMDRIYPRLYGVARKCIRDDDRPRMRVTELVHESYLRLARQHRRLWHNRLQFFSVIARLMRRVLLDERRAAARLKRGGDLQRLDIDPADLASQLQMDTKLNAMALTTALERLSSVDPDGVRLVALRFSRDLTIEQAADELGIGRSSAIRNWRFCRAWLRRELSS